MMVVMVEHINDHENNRNPYLKKKIFYYVILMLMMYAITRIQPTTNNIIIRCRTNLSCFWQFER